MCLAQAWWSGSPCKRLSIKGTDTVPLHSGFLPTSSTGLCGETPFSPANLYQPVPMARWTVQEREANMEECGVGCAQKSCRRQHQAGTGTKAWNPLLKASIQLIDQSVTAQEDHWKTMWIAQRVELGCSRGSVWMLGLRHPHCPPPTGTQVPLGSCRLTGRH